MKDKDNLGIIQALREAIDPNHPALQHTPKEWESLGLGQLCDQLARHEGAFNQSEDLQEVLYNVKSAIANALDEIQVPYVDELDANNLGPSR